MFRLLISFIFCFSLTGAFSQLIKVEAWYDKEKHFLKERYYVQKKSPSIQDSLYTSFYQNGRVKAKGYFIRNKANGLWEYYFENGNLKASGELKDDVATGDWIYYYENGGVSMQGKIEKGLKEGGWKFYYENGNMKSTGLYQKGKKEGLWRYFHEDGKFKAQANFVNDKGLYTEFYGDGKVKSEGMVENGQSNGQWKYYYENGNIKAEGEEKAGLKHGYWKYYHENGELASEGNYINGKEEGNWKYYHKNGQLSAEGENKDGYREGYWKLYYETGALKGEGSFVKGDGEYKEYYESGKLKVKGKVEKGKNEGEWLYYYESGKIEGKCFFTNGKGYYKGYYENGNLKMEGKIEDGNKVGIWKLYNEGGTLAGYYKTYYENEVPVFVPIEEEKQIIVKIDTLKPAEKPGVDLPKKKSVHYTKKLNEYQNFIISIQPLGLLRNYLSISGEYYFQERLGYEFNFTVHRNPLLKNPATLPINSVYRRGFSVYFRQKLYQKDYDNGMFYWAQEVRFANYDWFVNTADSTSENILLQAKVSTYEFSILFGDRLLKDARKSGWTLDIFGGLGIGYRTITRNYQKDPSKDALFLGLKTRSLTIPLRLGFSIGFLF